MPHFWDGLIHTLIASVIFKFVIASAIADTILGFLRAIKEHKFNSAAGIDGAIRKAAMLVSLCFLAFIDASAHLNLIGMIPEQLRSMIGLEFVGACDFFGLLYLMYEIVSILKNMTLLKIPVPKGIQNTVRKFLDEMTEEMPNQDGKEIVKK